MSVVAGQRGYGLGGAVKGEMEHSLDEKARTGGVLYVVATPLGNLEDITLRALRVLEDADLIAAESTEHSRNLCNHHGIRARLTRYNQHNQRAKTPELIRKLKSGMRIALITNAGTPGVSDPGVYLVSRALEEGIRVMPVPGPSAVASALSVSGLRGEKFLFWGYLSSKASKRKKELKGLVGTPQTIVFFEAPHRLREMFEDLAEVFGDRPVVLIREMTKVFETVKRGTAGDLLRQLEPDQVRGEVTLVVAGKDKEADEAPLDEEIEEKIQNLLSVRGMTLKDIAGQLSAETGAAFRDIYRAALVMKRTRQLS
jgi:16S rRNA (cytidine1402-2'-O)-methyltransferase